VSRSGEFDWISQYLAPLAGPNSFALTDDAALLEVPKNQNIVVTQDAIAEGVHFLTDDRLDWVARKALRVNISDIVAKGGRPYAYSMALGVPDQWRDTDMQLFCQGLAEDQRIYDMTLTGGDTYRSPGGLTIAITMFGGVSNNRYKSRHGASAGDILIVSGCIGEAALGLQVATGALKCAEADQRQLLQAYHLPDPPLALAECVAKHATASMDISDGLMGDCRKLCTASSVAAVVDRNAIPLSAPAKRIIEQDEALWKAVLAGGDDYQVLATVAPADVDAFISLACEHDLVATQIGFIDGAESGAVALDIDGVRVSIDAESYSHF